MMFVFIPMHSMVGMENDNEDAINRLLEIISLWKGHEKTIMFLNNSSRWGETIGRNNNYPTKIIIDSKKNDCKNSWVTLYSLDDEHEERIDYNLFLSLLKLIDSGNLPLAKDYLLKNTKATDDSKPKILLQEAYFDDSSNADKKQKMHRRCCILE
jgi:hypothetical protein